MSLIHCRMSKMATMQASTWQDDNDDTDDACDDASDGTSDDADEGVADP